MCRAASCAQDALGLAAKLPDDALGIGRVVQAANLVPRDRPQPLLGHTAEPLVPLAASGEMVVQHREHEWPIDILERLPQFVEIPQEVAFDAPAPSHAQQLE